MVEDLGYFAGLNTNARFAHYAGVFSNPNNECKLGSRTFGVIGVLNADITICYFSVAAIMEKRISQLGKPARACL
jgi:hypothetical protein